VRLAVDEEVEANNTLASTERTLPEAVAHYDDAVTALDVIGSSKATPEPRLHANGLEELLRDRGRADFFRGRAGRHVQKPHVIRRHRVEHVAALIAPVAKHRIRHDVAIDSLLRIGHPHERQPFRLQIREGGEQHALDDGEDRETAAEADRKSQADGGGEGAFA
jgi:hypothetical protein